MKSLLYTLLMLLLSTTVFAQTGKIDKIYLNNGSVLEVNVKKVGADIVEYTYPGEAAENEEKTTNIRTIVFASGRVQQFNTTDNQETKTIAKATAIEYKEIKPNTIAILPVAFYDKATGNLWEDQSKLAQSRIYDFFEDDVAKIAPLSMQDTRNTNAFLRKAGIDYTQLDETSIDDLEKIVGTEYLIISKVTCETKSQSTLNESTYGGTKKEGNKQTGAVYTSSTVNENKSYFYVVVLEIYKGSEKIYNETRKPMLNMEDSWKDAMEYMLKRTPIYKKK